MGGSRDPEGTEYIKMVNVADIHRSDTARQSWEKVKECVEKHYSAASSSRDLLKPFLKKSMPNYL